MQQIIDLMQVLVIFISNSYFIYYLISSLINLNRLIRVNSWFTCCRCLRDGSLEMVYKFTHNGNDYTTRIREKRIDIPIHCSRRLIIVVKPLRSSNKWKHINDNKIAVTIILSILCAVILLLEISLLWI